jgi:hypothetical protein
MHCVIDNHQNQSAFTSAPVLILGQLISQNDNTKSMMKTYPKILHILNIPHILYVSCKCNIMNKHFAQTSDFCYLWSFLNSLQSLLLWFNIFPPVYCYRWLTLIGRAPFSFTKAFQVTRFKQEVWHCTDRCYEISLHGRSCKINSNTLLSWHHYKKIKKKTLIPPHNITEFMAKFYHKNSLYNYTSAFFNRPVTYNRVLCMSFKGPEYDHESTHLGVQNFHSCI